MRYAIIVLLLIALVTPVCANGHLAIGDQITISTDGGSCRAYLFGSTMQMLEGSPNECLIHITPDMSYTLPEGEYKVFLQYKGTNNVFDIGYTGTKFTSIYKDVPDIDVTGQTPWQKQTAFSIMKNSHTDDQFTETNLYVELPKITLTNMYTKENGDLHLIFTTNLFEGNKISASIEPEIYAKTEYKNLMKNSSVVTYKEDGNTFWLEFPVEAADQLTSGQHTIYITYMENKQLSVPFKRYTREVPPTPTPVIEHYFSFTGEEMGYKVNTERISTPTPTPEPVYVKPTYVTALTSSRTDRVVRQRDDVFIGEKNLDVTLAVGWQDPDTTNYNYVITWCDGDGTEYVIPQERHFDVDPAIFSGKEGAWCQKGDDREPIVAFFVKKAYLGNVTVRDASGNVVTPAPTINITPAETSYMVVEGETTVATTIQTPVPVPTTETITLPLPIWIVLAALVIVVMRK